MPKISRDELLFRLYIAVFIVGAAVGLYTGYLIWG